MTPVVAIRLIFLLDGLIIAKWLPHIPDIQHELGLDIGQLGLALAALPLGIMVSLPLAGSFLVSRLSERAAIRLTFIWLALTSVLPGLAWDLPSLAVALFFYGSGIAGVEVAMNATADAVETRTGRRIMSSCHGLWSVGNLAGAALGSLALSLQISVDVALLVSAPALAIVAVAATGSLARAPMAPASGPTLALPDLPLLLLCVVPFCACILEGAMADWSAVYLRSEHGAQAALTGAGFGVFAAVMASIRLMGDRIIDRIGPTAIVRACGLCGIAGLGLLWLAPNAWAALPAFALMGFAASLIFPISVSAAARQPGRSPALNIAALSLICFSGYVIGPPVVGLVADMVGLRSALLLLMPFAVCIVLLASRLQGARAPQAGAMAEH